MNNKYLKKGKSVLVGSLHTLSIIGLLLIASVEVQGRESLVNVVKPIQDSVIVTGRVIDEDGKPLDGVAVREVGSQYVVFTNGKGKFTLPAKSGAVLVFALEGMQEEHYTLGKKQKIKVKMKFDLGNAGASGNKVSGDEEVYVVVEELPEFLADGGNIQAFLSRNLRYPKEAVDKKIQGKVMVSFIITKIGRVTNVRVIRSVHPLLDQEAIRVISIMPKWKPGKQNGKAVNTSYTVPINFHL